MPYLYWDMYLAEKPIKKSSNPNKRLAAIIIISGCIIVPFIQMFLVWVMAIRLDNAVDFAWQMIFGAFCDSVCIA